MGTPTENGGYGLACPTHGCQLMKPCECLHDDCDPCQGRMPEVSVMVPLSRLKLIRQAIESGKENAETLRSEHRTMLGTTTRKNKALDDMYTKDIEQAEALLAELDTVGVR